MTIRLHQVNAAAGSGKTYSLTQKYLHLLAQCVLEKQANGCFLTGASKSIGSILAVTFTNKAAEEMRGRILLALKECALSISDIEDKELWTAEKAERFLDTIFEQYHILQIRTIDSLIHLIVRLFALQYGVSPQFEVRFDTKELYTSVYDEFIANCETDKEKEQLLKDALKSLIYVERSKNFWLRDVIQERLFAIIDFLSKNNDCKSGIRADKEEISARFFIVRNNVVEAVLALLKHAELLDIPFSANAIKFFKRCEQLQFEELFNENTIADTFAKKDSVLDCVNKAGKDLCDGELEALYQQLKKAFKDYIEQGAVYSSAFKLFDFISLAEYLLPSIKKRQKELSILSANELPHTASELLTKEHIIPEAFCRMGQRIEHVLIDEFQDTSNEQWNILANLSEESLSKGGSLYYVGDKKQAIYGWRDGGDAKLFDTVFANSLVSNLVEEEEKKQEILGFNWRSTKEIVTFNNDFFSFLAESESVKDLVTKLASDASYALQNEFIENIKNTFYECSQAIPKKNEQLAGYVRFQKIPKEGKKSENQKEVLAVLEKLLKEELLPRRAYKDIAILVRDSTEAKIISAHLLALNIPVITENSLQLAQHPLIEQMLGFLAFIDYPMDNYAFVQFVIGEQFFLEEVGLTKNTIYEWILRQKKGKNYYKAFKEDFASIATRYIEPYY